MLDCKSTKRVRDQLNDKPHGEVYIMRKLNLNEMNIVSGGAATVPPPVAGKTSTWSETVLPSAFSITGAGAAGYGGYLGAFALVGAAAGYVFWPVIVVGTTAAAGIGLLAGNSIGTGLAKAGA